VPGWVLGDRVKTGSALEIIGTLMVGATGIEPVTPTMSGWKSRPSKPRE
jgi:hypothetical protein